MRMTAGLVLCLTIFGEPQRVMAQSRTNYESLVARSMNFFSGDIRRFGVSDPWPTAVGSTMLCVRPEVPDGRGGRRAVL